MTDRQAKLLAFIRQQIAETGVSPSYDEMCAQLGLASKSGIHRMMKALERQGRISMSRHQARSVRVRRAEMPDRSALRMVSDAALRRLLVDIEAVVRERSNPHRAAA